MTLSLSLWIIPALFRCLSPLALPLYLLLDVRMCSHWLILFTHTDTFLPSQSLFRQISPPVILLILLISCSSAAEETLTGLYGRHFISILLFISIKVFISVIFVHALKDSSLSLFKPLSC